MRLAEFELMTGTPWRRLGALAGVLVALGCGAKHTSAGEDQGGDMAGTAATGGAEALGGSEAGGGAQNEGGRGDAVGGVAGSETREDCGSYGSLWPRLAWSTTHADETPLGLDGDQPYEGPVTVWSSVPERLVLAYEVAGRAVHSAIAAGDHPLPALDVGRSLWLFADPIGGTVMNNPAIQTPPGFGWSLRAARAGQLLFGAGYNSESEAAPVRLGALHELCVVQSPSCPGPDAKAALKSVQILGDQAVTINSGSSADVLLDGVVYEVEVSAHRAFVTGSDLGLCGEYLSRTDERVVVTVMPKDFEQVLQGQ